VNIFGRGGGGCRCVCRHFGGTYKPRKCSQYVITSRAGIPSYNCSIFRKNTRCMSSPKHSVRVEAHPASYSVGTGRFVTSGKADIA
jgi:hypothetical protein